MKTIKLGCAISFTGGQSRSGKLYRDSYDMAVDAINKGGGVKVGGKAYRFEIVYYDDKSSPTESSKLVEKLIAEDKVGHTPAALPSRTAWLPSATGFP